MEMIRVLRAGADAVAITTTPSRMRPLEHDASLIAGVDHGLLLEVDVALSGSRGGRLLLACYIGRPDDPANVSAPMTWPIQPVATITLSNAHTVNRRGSDEAIPCGALIWTDADEHDVRVLSGESRLTVFPALAITGMPDQLLVPTGIGD